jgi:hypothetical protein
MDVWFFKPSFPFHRLVGSCLNNDLSQLSTTVAKRLNYPTMQKGMTGYCNPLK